MRDQHLGAGGRIVSLAFRRFHQGEVAHGWLAGLNVGLLDGYPTGVRDCITDAAQRADGQPQEGNDCLDYFAAQKLLEGPAAPGGRCDHRIYASCDATLD